MGAGLPHVRAKLSDGLGDILRSWTSALSLAPTAELKSDSCRVFGFYAGLML